MICIFSSFIRKIEYLVKNVEVFWFEYILFLCIVMYDDGGSCIKKEDVYLFGRS